MQGELMRYCVSDIHGEYELFEQLLKKIKFSSEDKMYICGDIIDKGKSPVKLAKYISSFSPWIMHLTSNRRALSIFSFS